MYIDAHVHLHEDPSMKEEIPIIIAVSDDLESSKKTIEIADNPCIGIHPWQVEEASEEELRELEKLVERAICIGEVGLDYRYVKNKEKQLNFFITFLELSKEYDLPLNVHALDAWREAFELLLKYDVRRAYFHWYNGPLDLIEEIVGQGYFIGINAALKVQKKHMKVLERTPLKAILTESDGPYRYRGLNLRPKEIPWLVNKIAEVKGISKENVVEEVYRNLVRWLDKLPKQTTNAFS